MISGALAILKSEAQRNEMSAIYEKNKKRGVLCLKIGAKKSLISCNKMIYLCY